MTETTAETPILSLRRPSFRLFLLVFLITSLLFLGVYYLLPALLHPYAWFLELQARMGLFGIYLMILTPLVAWGIFAVSRWGWYLFLIFYLQLAIYVGLQLPLHTGRGAFWWLLLLLCAVFLAVWVLMSRTVREPFFAAEERGWRISRRLPLKLPARLYAGDKVATAISRDISMTGALVELTDSSLNPTLNEIDGIEFQFSQKDSVRLPCRMARFMEKDGQSLVAVFFSKENRQALDLLKALLNSKYENRHLFRKPAMMIWPGEKRVARLYNISRGGCYLEANPDYMKEGDEIIVRIDLGVKTSIERGGTVVWINSNGDYGKRPGLGIRFNDSLLMHPVFALYYFFRIKGLPLVR